MSKSDTHAGISRFAAKKCVGSGWARLIEKAYDKMPAATYVTQVKEKWGGLRIYVSTAPTLFFDFLDKLEDESLHTCEACGLPGIVDENAGWWKTLCPTCRNISTDDLDRKFLSQ